MNKQELVEKVVADCGITKATADKMVKSVFAAISEALANGEKVALPGFGTLEIRDRAAKEARNPQTGAVVKVPARKAVAFKAGKSLKEAVNK